MLVAVQLSVLGLYLPPVFKVSRCHRSSAPDDHFTAGPDRRVTESGSGRVGRAGRGPTVGARDCICRRCSKTVAVTIRPRRSFHCRSRPPCGELGQRARWWCWWLSNCRCWDCICRRCSKGASTISIRPRRSFHCRSTRRCDAIRAVGALVVLVAVQLSVLGLYLPPVFKCAVVITLRPRRSFHCRSKLPCDRIGQQARWSCWWLSSCPCWDCISRRCSKRCRTSSAPDDHFTAGPDCRVIVSGSRRISGARSRPASVHGGSPASAIFGRV